MGLLDLVDVAVNVQQSRRIGQTREQLARMEQGMLQEAERRQFIESLRNVVFTVGQNIRALEQRVEANAAAALRDGQGAHTTLAGMASRRRSSPNSPTKNMCSRCARSSMRSRNDHGAR